MIRFRKSLLLIFLLLILIPIAEAASTDDKRSVHRLSTPPEVAPASILEARRPLGNLMQTHQNLQIEREQQVAEIQRIMEQARVEQQAMRASSAAHKARGTSTVVPGIDIQEAFRDQRLPLFPKTIQKDLPPPEKIEAIAMPDRPAERKDKKGQ